MRKLPLGLIGLSVFFLFGSVVSAVTFIALIFPGGVLEPIWRLNPQAHEGFMRMGAWAVPLMVAVSAACGLSACGLLGCARWGYWLAISVLGVNLGGDVANAVLNRDMRTLIGLPVGGMMIGYLLNPRMRRLFFGGHDR